MAQPPIRDEISEMSPLFKTRYGKRDPNSMKARKGFRRQVTVRGVRPLNRSPKR